MEVENKKDVNLILGVVYNHPRRDPAQFIEFLSTTLRKLTNENKKLYFLVISTLICCFFKVNLLLKIS